MKRIFALCLAFSLLLSILPCAYASEPATSGTCGSSAAWSFSGGTLTISGTGEIANQQSFAPWYDFRDQIETVIVEEGITRLDRCLFLNHEALKEVRLPDSLTFIGNQCFQGCDSLTTITVPKNVSQIGSGSGNYAPASVFDGDSWAEIIVEEGNANYYSKDGVLFDRKQNALLCYPMAKPGKSYTVPDGVQIIEYGALWLNELEEIILPEGLLKIQDSAFYRSKISSIRIPDSVTYIGDRAFSQCNSLESISLPANLDELGMDTFESCANLQTIYVNSRDCFIPGMRWTLGSDSVVYGYENSTAHTHAINYGLEFKNIETGETLTEKKNNSDMVALLPVPTSVSASVSCIISMHSGVKPTITGYQPRILLEKDTSNATYQEILATVNSLTANCTSEYAKAQAICDWVNSNLTYQFGKVFWGEGPQDIYNLWQHRIANCMGYTQLANFMLYLAGIQTATADGYDHTWSCVYADGRWIMMDATNGFITESADNCQDISKISFSVDNNIVCVIDDFTGVKMACYGLSIYEHAEVAEITIPDYITHIYKSTFFLEDCYGSVTKDLIIKGTKGSYAEQYIREQMPHYAISYNADQFVAAAADENDPAEHTHTIAVRNAVSAACEKEGYSGDEYCGTCGETVKTGSVIPALEHTYVDGKCTACGASDPANEQPAASGITRVYGDNRYRTAMAVADQLKKTLGVEKFNAIVVACGTNFADALAGSYLAVQKNAPILLVNKNTVNAVKEYITANLASGGMVYLLGGTGVVPAELENALTGLNVKRLAGANRYATNLLILAETKTDGQEILICTGREFADGLSASAVNKPILLVNKKLNEDQKKFLQASSGKFIIIGGEGAVSAELEAELKTYGSVERIDGANRYETSAAVAKRFFSSTKTAVLAYAKNFPDGLCGGPLAYAMKAPLILTAIKRETAAVTYAKENGIQAGFVLGGPSLISDEAVANIFG